MQTASDTGTNKSSAETRALEPERPTGRRGALCTRAPSWTFTSFDPCGSQFMPASRQATDGARRCRQAATSTVTLRPRVGWLVLRVWCGPSGPPFCGGQWSPRVILVLIHALVRAYSPIVGNRTRTHTANRSTDCSVGRL
jgi:hypothetical protein